MADNPFNPKLGGLLGAIGADPRGNSLLDCIAPPPPKSDVSGIVDALMGGSKAAPPVGLLSGAAKDLFGTTPPAYQNPFGNLGAAADLFQATLPVNPHPYSDAISDLFAPYAVNPSNALSGAAA